jgi:hypothetical protein
MDVIALVIPTLLGEPGAVVPESVTEGDVWDATSDLLEWIIQAAKVAGQPLPLEVIAGASTAMNAATPSAEDLDPSSTTVLDREAGLAYITTVLLNTTVLAAYLISCPLWEFLDGTSDTLNTIAELRDGEILTSESLRTMVMLCTPTASQGIADSIEPILDQVAPLAPASGEFEFSVHGVRMFSAMFLLDHARQQIAANALGVDMDHFGVQRMLEVASPRRGEGADIDSSPDHPSFDFDDSDLQDDWGGDEADWEDDTEL